MLYVENDRDLIAAVSRALGESRSLVRNRGFQLIEIVVFNGDESLPDGLDSFLPARLLLQEPDRRGRAGLRQADGAARRLGRTDRHGLTPAGVLRLNP